MKEISQASIGDATGTSLMCKHACDRIQSMKTVGIIAEFNPFHNGHSYLLKKAKEITGADTAVVIMSGDFVQRGAPSICNKYLRTRMALSDEADIIFELPVIYSLGSAELFAEGALKLLLSTGQIDYLCFGSEAGDTAALSKCAHIIEEYTSTDAFKEDLSNQIKNGVSYPSAFSGALSNALGNLQTLLYSPNNLLGIEYLRALIRLKASGCYTHIPEPLAVKRTGSDHFSTEISEFSSASAIRNHIISRYDLSMLSSSMPKHAFNLISENINLFLPITEDDFSTMLYIRLNTLTDKELFDIPDINRDLIHKLIDFRVKKTVFSELIMNLKSKCFTYTSISRALFRILLEPYYSHAYLYLNSNNSIKPYLRVLGFKRSSSEFLRKLRYSESCDVITKPSAGNMADPSYLLDIHASGLYEQACSEKYRTGFIEELKTGPVII